MYTALGLARSILIHGNLETNEILLIRIQLSAEQFNAIHFKRSFPCSPISKGGIHSISNLSKAAGS